MKRGKRESARENEKDSRSTSRLNFVNNPAVCFKINCLQFIRRTVKCRLHKRLRGKLPLQNYSM